MLKILMAASEANPFAKTGGLADVLGSLPQALITAGADVRVIMPKYGTIPSHLKNGIIHKRYLYIPLGHRSRYAGLEEAKYKGVTFYFIDNEEYFKRGGLYGYEDDGERFAFFCKAVLELIPYLDFVPDILHCHDWQTGMIPVLLEAFYRTKEPYEHIQTVFTIHNLKYQGIFPVSFFKEFFGLEDSWFTIDKLEFYGNASFMKGGLVFSKALTTVSKTYSEEIRYPYFGEGLEGVLSARKEDLYGIINGIDCDEFDPFTDSLIVKRYDKDSLENKEENKAELQLELNLPIRRDVPVIGLVSRLTDQKGLDLIACVLDELLMEDIQFVVLGTGDPQYENMFREAQRKYPNKMSANIRFDNTLAHRIYASSDLFLMPSLFEPCGLGQMIAMRYGSLPVVRETGGLKDTVIPYNEFTGEGNGFSFQNINAHDMLYTVRYALRIYKDKERFRSIQKEAMAGDFSWNRSALRYLEVYKRTVE
ncbi:MAG: glycogen synthase GlgA [Clostridia bacterium]|jgi:starch synthase